eukprot:sb/3479121/
MIESYINIIIISIISHYMQSIVSLQIPTVYLSRIVCSRQRKLFANSAAASIWVSVGSFPEFGHAKFQLIPGEVSVPIRVHTSKEGLEAGFSLIGL